MFMHLAVHTILSDVRRATTGVLGEAVLKRPQLLNAVLRDALVASLAKPVGAGKSGPTAVNAASEEQEKPVVDKRGRYAAVLLACVRVGEELDGETKAALVVDWLVLAHHPAICRSPLSYCHVLFDDAMGQVHPRVRCGLSCVSGRGRIRSRC